jgi:hypothetical protein
MRLGVTFAVALIFASSCFAQSTKVGGTGSTKVGGTGSTKVGAGVSFDPQTQGTLVNWYVADTLGLANGANVTSWTDSKTGAPNTMTAASNFPTYATGQQNGLSTVNFASVGSQNLPTGGSTASAFPRTIVAVIKIANTSSAYTIIGPSAAGGIQLRTDASTGTLTLNKASTATIGTSTGTVGTGAYHIVIATLDSGTYGFFIDSSTSAGSGAHAQTLTAARTFRLGVNTNTEFFNGYIGEIQIYSSVLSAGDIAGCIAQLKSKWNIP